MLWCAMFAQFRLTRARRYNIEQGEGGGGGGRRGKMKTELKQVYVDKKWEDECKRVN